MSNTKIVQAEIPGLNRKQNKSSDPYIQLSDGVSKNECHSREMEMQCR